MTCGTQLLPFSVPTSSRIVKRGWKGKFAEWVARSHCGRKALFSLFLQTLCTRRNGNHVITAHAWNMTFLAPVFPILLCRGFLFCPLAYLSSHLYKWSARCTLSMPTKPLICRESVRSQAYLVLVKFGLTVAGVE